MPAKTKQSPVRNIRFGQELYDDISAFAKANGLEFTPAVKLLLTNALRNPQVINPKDIKKNNRKK